jgi:hypothetical protein
VSFADEIHNNTHTTSKKLEEVIIVENYKKYNKNGEWDDDKISCFRNCKCSIF